MKTNKVLIGGIAGGVAFFFLGWLIYGMLLTDYMETNTNQCIMKPMEDMTMWAMGVSNIVLGLLLATIFSWAGVSGAAAGAKTAAIVGAMMSLSFDLTFFSMSTMFSNLGIVLVDVLAYTFMLALGGAVIAYVMGMGKKEGA
jgi:hypothetical protein